MTCPTLLVRLSVPAMIALFIAASVPAHSAQGQGEHPAAQPAAAASPDEGIYKEATVALQKKDYKEAADKLAVIVNKYPFSQFYEPALFQLGQVSYINGSKEEGIKLLESALVLYPRSTHSREAALRAADYYYDQRRSDEALKHYSFLLDHFSGPSLSDHIYLRGSKLKAATGNLEGAVQDLEHFVREHMASPYFNEAITDLVTVYNQLGRAYQSAELIDRYQKRFTAMSDDGRALIAASDAFLALGLHERAIAVLDDLDRVYPKSKFRLDALVRKGQAFKGQKDYEKAEKALKQALAINRQSPEAVLALSMLYGEKGQTREALTVLEAIPQPANDRTGMLLAMQRGTLLAKVGRYSDALKAYDGALAKAEKLKESDSRAKETLPKIYVGMGDVLYSQEKFTPAIDAYQKAKDGGAAADDIPWILYRQGEGWEKTGDNAKAAESYQALLTATTDPFWTGRANSRLEAIAWNNRLNKKEKTTP